jgi:hypothetical protein
MLDQRREDRGLRDQRVDPLRPVPLEVVAAVELRVERGASARRISARSPGGIRSGITTDPTSRIAAISRVTPLTPQAPP